MADLGAPQDPASSRRWTTIRRIRGRSRAPMTSRKVTGPASKLRGYPDSAVHAPAAQGELPAAGWRMMALRLTSPDE
jgi:hypothetical protein